MKVTDSQTFISEVGIHAVLFLQLQDYEDRIAREKKLAADAEEERRLQNKGTHVNIFVRPWLAMHW